MARRFGGHVTVMFVNDPLLLAAASAAYGGRRRFVERTTSELRTFIKRATGSGAAQREEFASIVSTGDPSDEILREARKGRSDLIVMGSHGLSGLRKVFFGSTTEQVLRTATVPVAAIPPSLGAKSKGVAAVRRIVAPIDLAGAWQSDAIRAGKIAGEFDAELLLVHVLARTRMPPWLRAGTRSNDRRRIEDATMALERIRTERLSGVSSVATMVVIGDPAHEIARITTRRQALVVMSLRGTAGVWGMRRGSIAYHVLTHASTPVLALPAGRPDAVSRRR